MLTICKSVSTIYMSVSTICLSVYYLKLLLWYERPPQEYCGLTIPALTFHT